MFPLLFSAQTLGMLTAFRQAVNVLYGWFCVRKAQMVDLQAACAGFYKIKLSLSFFF